jgi:acyl-coenzyme A thioesterase PaaI-like protein
MEKQAFQDYYPDSLSHCYGCGRLNQDGLQIKSYWDGEESVCYFKPRACHTAVPGFVYGGLIASLIDCHGTGTASAAAYRAENRALGTEPFRRYVTGSLQVSYLRPTPIDAQLELRGTVKSLEGRKAVISVTLSAKGELCARGEVVAIQIPDHMFPEPKK